MLDGLRVVDFSAMIAGPYCTRWLADMGAEVIKIEPPEGDAMRAGAPLREGHSAYFAQLNAGKRSVVLDLKDPDAVAAAKALASGADVVVQNFRPGVMKRLGLDWGTLQPLNPRLVYCSISGYGQDGPKSGRPAYAPVVQAASGYDMANFAYQDGLERPPNAGLFPTDILAACYALIAIQSALLHRAATGLGQHLDVTLMESILSVLVYEFQEAQFPIAQRRPLYTPIPAQDGFIVVAPITQRNFEALCDALDHPDWKTDLRFATSAKRREHWSALTALVTEWAGERPSAECEETLLDAGVPCSRYASVADVIADPHFQQRGSFVGVDDGAGALLIPNLPFRSSGAETAVRPAVPALGQHTAQMLDDLDMLAPAACDRLVRAVR